MRTRIISRVFGGGLLAAVASLSFAPVAMPQVVPCACKAVLSLQPDPNCMCTGLTVSNVLTRKGRCGTIPNQCTNSITKCLVQGNVSETGCTGGFVDVPFQIESDCTLLGLSASYPILCTGGGGTHLLWLDCQACH